MVLASSVCQGAPKALLGCQRCFVVCSGGRCWWTNYKIGLGTVVEMEWDLAFVPFRGVLTNDLLANPRSRYKSCDIRCLCAMVAARIPTGSLIRQLCVDMCTVDDVLDPAQTA